jgi:L-alanine-DL-glutamate epimerase-like enolase superfamily enzyme
MKVTKVEATTHRVPARVPLLKDPVMREIVFVRVETDGGLTGYGITGPIQRFGVANGWRVEFHVPMWVTGEMIFRDPPKPVRGTVTLPDRPGLGLEPNEDALRDTLER